MKIKKARERENLPNFEMTVEKVSGSPWLCTLWICCFYYKLKSAEFEMKTWKSTELAAGCQPVTAVPVSLHFLGTFLCLVVESWGRGEVCIVKSVRFIESRSGRRWSAFYSVLTVHLTFTGQTMLEGFYFFFPLSRDVWWETKMYVHENILRWSSRLWLTGSDWPRRCKKRNERIQIFQPGEAGNSEWKDLRRLWAQQERLQDAVDGEIKERENAVNHQEMSPRGKAAK